MSRPATGQVLKRDTRDGFSWALRFRAQGRRQYVTLGSTDDGWTRQRAERELAATLRDVEAGEWKPPASAVPTVADPSFHEFASDWFEAKRREVGRSTARGYEAYLTRHLLPFFDKHQLSQITIAEVDRYRESKVREHVLGAETINKTLKLLGQILDVAEERELIVRNPMRVNPRRRNLKVRRPTAVWLDRADQIAALLDAAGQIDARAREDRRHVGRRTILATLTFAGLRIGELCDLRWRDVDLSAGRLRVRRSKTDAGARYVDLLPQLLDELKAHRGRHADAGQLTPVFATSTGGRMSERNIAQRVLEPAIVRANEILEQDGHVPLPEGLTLHKLRHTCCSLLFVCGYELPRVMSMLGHADASTTLRVYAHVMAAGDEDRQALRRLVLGSDWAASGHDTGFATKNSAAGPGAAA